MGEQGAKESRNQKEETSLQRKRDESRLLLKGEKYWNLKKHIKEIHYKLDTQKQRHKL